jgi:large repetitive protein
MSLFHMRRPFCAVERLSGLIRCLLVVFSLLTTSLSAQFALPRISSFSPVVGEPGTVVTITGSGFQTAGSVLFGVGSAQLQVLNDTQIRAVVPSDATTGPVTVNTSRGFAASLSFFQVAPRITSFEPVFGKPGNVIILRGANFSGLTQVWVGGKFANFQTVGETQLSFAVPADATSGVIRIVAAAGQAESEDAFQVIGPEPFILEFDPPMAPPGQLIVIRGVQFSNASEVVFSEDMQGVFSVVADTQIIVRVPADAGSGPVKITTPLGSGVSPGDFLVLGAGPFITGLNPEQGQAGDNIIVEGVNLSGVTELFLNDDAADFEVVADTQLSFTIPDESTSGFLRLVTPTDEYTSDIELGVIGPEPVIDSFTPASGLPGTRVQFQGIHFVHVESVFFGDEEATFESAAETQLTAIVPTDAETGLITIKTAFGESVTESEFVVEEPSPTLDSFSPGVGSIGTQVTLLGSYFNGVSGVFFGEKETSFEVVADSQILTSVPVEAITGTIRLVYSSGEFVSDSLFYLPAEIESFDPVKAPPGAQLTINGSNFTGTSKVRIGGKEAEIFSIEPDELVVIIPSDALIGTVSVSTPAGALATELVFGVLPFIQEISPVAGPIGTLVQVKGGGFTEVQTALIGELAVAFTIQSHNLIEITVPSDTPSGQVTFVNPVGLAVSDDSFQLRTAADLSLEVAPALNPSSWQFPNSFTIKVHNAGPSAVSNFFLRHTLPSGSELITSENPHGATVAADLLIISGIVSLVAGETAEIVHTITTPHFGFETHIFQIDTEIFDPNTEDQQLEWVQQIVGPPIRLEVNSMIGEKHRVSWHSELRGFELKSRSTLLSDNPWQVPTSPFSSDGPFLDFENTESQVFYILERVAQP